METLQRLHNRGSISTDTTYTIDNSLKFDSGNSEYLYITRDTSGSDWNRLKWTASMWVKHIPTESSATAPKERMFGASDTQSDFDIRFRGQPLGFRNNSDVDGVGELRTTAVFRDYSAWMHVVAVWDTANATAGNRMRLYVNGEEITDFSTDTQPSQNEKSIWGKKNDGTDGNVVHAIGCQVNASTGFTQGFNGYMAEIHWVEGEALAPTDFGEFDDDSAIWIPKEYTGSYGTNGFYLDFSNSSSLGADASGNGNNWTLNNIAAADQSTDTPTNNFATINILHGQTSDSTYSEGATYAVNGQFFGWQPYIPTIAVTSGKWYFETQGGGPDMYLQTGMGDEGDILEWGINQKYYGRSGSKSVAYYGGTGGNGLIYPAQAAPDPAVDYGSSDIIGCAVDIDNGYVYWSKNGTYINSGVPTSGSTGTGGTAIPTGGNSNGTYYLGAATYADSNMKFNYGGYTTISISSGASDANGYGTFEYAPPTGYYALCTKNLSEYG